MSIFRWLDIIFSKYHDWLYKIGMTSTRIRLAFHCFVAIITICITWLVISYTDILDKQWAYFDIRELDFAIGFAFSVVSLVFGILIYRTIIGGFAKDIEQFLMIINEFLLGNNNHNNENGPIEIYTPTLFLGGIKKSTYHSKYSEKIKKMINNGNIINLHTCYGNADDFLNEYNKIKKGDNFAKRDKNKVIERYESNPLVDFHYQIFLKRSKEDSVDDLVDYFENVVEFFTFMMGKTNVTKIEDYPEDYRMIAFLQKDKGIYGVFSEDYDISGHNISGENIVNSIKQLLTQ